MNDLDRKENSDQHLTCAVVVCTRDRLQALDACLAAVCAGTRKPDELIVVDSGPQRFSAEQVAARWGAAYLREERPGVSRARNYAASAATSDIIVYVDDDAVPEAGWLDPLIREFADPDVALSAGKILPPEVDRDMMPTYAWLDFVDLGMERRVIDRSVPNWYVTTNFGGVGFGANMAIRRSVFAEWGGFDPRLGVGTLIYGHEELKAFFELVERGYSIVYTPGSVVRHAFPRRNDALRVRALRTIEASAAYMTLLLCEQPAHRKETRKYIRSKLSRVRQLYTRASVRQPLLPGYLIFFARIKGVLLYAATRIVHGGGKTQSA